MSSAVVAPTAEVSVAEQCAVPCASEASVAASLDPVEAGRLAEVFKLLGDPTRLRLLAALADRGELCVCDLAAAVDSPESNVSHALRLLRTAGLVRNRRAGRLVYYALDDDHVRLVLATSRAHVAHTVG